MTGQPGPNNVFRSTTFKRPPGLRGVRGEKKKNPQEAEGQGLSASPPPPSVVWVSGFCWHPTQHPLSSLCCSNSILSFSWKLASSLTDHHSGSSPSPQDKRGHLHPLAGFPWNLNHEQKNKQQEEAGALVPGAAPDRPSIHFCQDSQSSPRSSPSVWLVCFLRILPPRFQFLILLPTCPKPYLRHLSNPQHGIPIVAQWKRT